MTGIELIKQKLISRKFWVAITFGVIAVFGDELGFEIDADQLRNIAYVVLVYLGGQSLVDTVKE